MLRKTNRHWRSLKDEERLIVIFCIAAVGLVIAMGALADFQERRFTQEKAEGLWSSR